MELLNAYKTATFPVFLEVLNKEILIRPIGHGDTKAILELLEKYRYEIDLENKSKKLQNKKKEKISSELLVAQQSILKACIMPDSTGQKPDPRDLHTADVTKLYAELKKISSGTDGKEVYFQCKNKNCVGKDNEPHVEKIPFDFNDSELLNMENKDIRTATFKNVDQQFTFDLKPHTFGIVSDNAKFYNGTGELDKMIDSFYSSFIDSITLKKDDGEEKTFDDLTKEDIIAFLGNCSDMDLKSLSEYIDKQPMWKWEKDWDCPVCGTKNKAIVDTISSFFSI